MNIEARILFEDVVAGVGLDDIAYQLQCCINEQFYPEVTRVMPETQTSVVSSDVSSQTAGMFASQLEAIQNHVQSKPQSKPEPEQPSLDSPIYCVSDLHMGDGGPRDNFAHMSDGNRPEEFNVFLDHVEERNGRLFILGDFFELWQSNISKVITHRVRLLGRLARMKATYILGNHDADLVHFTQPSNEPAWLSHPFFKTMCTSHTEMVNGECFRFIHGHQVDPYCANDTPGIGRISAIYSGIWEDRHGHPQLNKRRTVEDATVGRLGRISSFLRKLIGRPGRYQVMNEKLRQLQDWGAYNGLITGHTHRAGQVKGAPVYNTGSWAEGVCSYVVIEPDAQVSVYDWINGEPYVNYTKLK